MWQQCKNVAVFLWALWLKPAKTMSDFFILFTNTDEERHFWVIIVVIIVGRGAPGVVVGKWPVRCL